MNFFTAYPLHLHLSKKFVWLLAVLGIASAGVVLAVFRTHQSHVTYTTEIARLATLTQTVSATGSMQSPGELNLLFTKTGTLASVDVAAGDGVVEGQVLATLSATNLEIQKTEQENAVASAQAKLDRLREGATATEINVARAKLASSQTALFSAQASLHSVEKTSAQNIEKAMVALANSAKQTIDVVEAKVKTLADAKQKYANSVTSADQTVTQAQGDALLTLHDALFDLAASYTTLNDIFTDLDIKDVFSVLRAAQKLRAQDAFFGLDDRNEATKSLVQAAIANPTETTVDAAFISTLSSLHAAADALLEMYAALGATITDSAYTSTEYTTDKTNVKNAQTTVAAALVSVQGARNAITDAVLAASAAKDAAQADVHAAESAYNAAVIARDTGVANAEQDLASAKELAAQNVQQVDNTVAERERQVQLAQTELTHLLAPPAASDVAASKADLDRAKAALALIEDAIKELSLLAPIAGTITEVNYKRGEQVNLTTPVVSLVGDMELEIAVDIAESDIAKIVLRDPVEVTFDAFGDEYVFPATVYFIDPAETVIEGVVYYRVKAHLLFSDDANADADAAGTKVPHELPAYPAIDRELLKPGMTANVTIFTAEKENVLVMPQRAVVIKGSDRLVRILQNNNTVSEVPVRIGLRGDNGLVEVLEGVQEGDAVVTFVQEGK